MGFHRQTGYRLGGINQNIIIDKNGLSTGYYISGSSSQEICDPNRIPTGFSVGGPSNASILDSNGLQTGYWINPCFSIIGPSKNIPWIKNTHQASLDSKI